MKKLDLIVLGTGVGGSTVATKCRAAGWQVAVVDDRPYGGTCALRGSEVKRVLVGAAETVEAARRMRGKGVDGDVRIDWRQLMHFKQTFISGVPEAHEQHFVEAGISTFHGTARFVGSNSVMVGSERLEADRIHVATGARPADLAIRGAEHLISSDEFLELESLPEQILFLGGSSLAFEFAHVCACAGAHVIVLEPHERPLANFDRDLVALLVERTRSMGVDLRLATRVEAIGKRDARFVVHATSDAGSVILEVDTVVHSAGRVPNVDRLDLEQAGIEFDEHGIVVNEYMQSVSNPAVYAAGDVAKGGMTMTPVASFEARVAAANLIEGNHRKMEYPPIPRAVFTLPPLASVGLQEEEARASGQKFETDYEHTSNWYSSRRVNERFSGYKVLVEWGTQRILGAHLLGPHADELINMFAMAMRFGLTSRDIKESIIAYPTSGSDIPHML